jgi:sensor histidine kinase regulating citrate/malate metabolism
VAPGSSTRERSTRSKVPGIPDQEIGMLSDGTEPSQLEHGSGIGPWAVGWIVRDCGGEVTIDSDDGTAVALHLPAVDDADPEIWATAEKHY